MNALPRFLSIEVEFECGTVASGTVAQDYSERLDFLFPAGQPFPCWSCNPGGLQACVVTTAHLQEPQGTTE